MPSSLFPSDRDARQQATWHFWWVACVNHNATSELCTNSWGALHRSITCRRAEAARRPACVLRWRLRMRHVVALIDAWHAARGEGFRGLAVSPRFFIFFALSLAICDYIVAGWRSPGPNLTVEIRSPSGGLALARRCGGGQGGLRGSAGQEAVKHEVGYGSNM